jgi:4-aminobutyrate aminotransferase
MQTLLELKLPEIRTALPGPKAKAILERDAKYISPSYTRSYPLVMERGYGAIIEDVDGNTFLDFNAGVAVSALGHAHPKIAEAIAIRRASSHISGTDYYYPHQTALAEPEPGYSGKLLEEGPLRKFGPRLWKAPQRRDVFDRPAKFIAFRGAFHGRTFGTLSLTASRSGPAKGLRPADARRNSRTLCESASLSSGLPRR